MFPTEGFQPTLLKLVTVLDRSRIRFHLTGGITSIVYGERAGFHFSEESARRAIESRQMFQLLDVDQVIKLDLYVRCLIPGELDRSVRTELFPGLEIPIASWPDAALSKLIWIHHGSHRSRRDLRRILAGATRDELVTVRGKADELDLSGSCGSRTASSDGILTL